MDGSDEIRLFSYKMTDDSGFAPNPFWGMLTLATCKPEIRRTKRALDWIAGFTSQSLNGDAVEAERLVFLMQIQRHPTIAEYYRDEEFRRKIPVPDSARYVEQMGDNIYRPLVDDAVAPNEFEQLKNLNHWDGKSTCTKPETRIHDVSGKRVLVASRFAYFGSEPLELPIGVRPALPKGQSASGSRTWDSGTCRRLIDFVFAAAGNRVIIAAPESWPIGDQSWKDAL